MRCIVRNGGNEDLANTILLYGAKGEAPDAKVFGYIWA